MRDLLVSLALLVCLLALLPLTHPSLYENVASRRGKLSGQTTAGANRSHGLSTRDCTPRRLSRHITERNYR